ncbi:hypothetical protein VTK26DRAFT_7859 [Humicola hyalothermophila]
MESNKCRARVYKFSSKPPRDQAARQRENQRRHRARVKGRIEELEAALSGTQKQLDEAQKCIDRLTGEVQRLQHALDSTRANSWPDSVVPLRADTASESEPAGPGSQLVPVSKSQTDVAPQTPDGFYASHLTEAPVAPVPHPRPAPLSSITLTEATGINIDAALRSAVSTTQSSCGSKLHEIYAGAVQGATLRELALPAADLTGTTATDDDDCPCLPPPTAGESTIPCREAFLIIRDRSAPDFDLSAAAEWLKPGFRRATVPGTGCRVQTHILFALVDRITSV